MITYNKLVRDTIIDRIHANDWTECHHIADDEEFETKLKDKLAEEAQELKETSIDEIKNELADVLRVTQELMKFYNITKEEIKEIIQKKDEKAGGFDKRIILEEASEF